MTNPSSSATHPRSKRRKKAIKTEPATTFLPPLWLLLLLVGFPLFSETVYTPSLPSIASYFACSAAQAENTLSIYLVGFACGTIIWGKLSDHIGRKPSLAIGMLIYILGCLGCYLAPNIEIMTLMRFIQALGGCSGSVLGQTICRDSFHGKKLGQVYSAIGTAIAVFPAVGPLFGGLIAQHTSWKNIFLLLLSGGVALILLATRFLPETRRTDHERSGMATVAKKMIRNPQTVCCAVIVSICQGMGFSYFGEAPFIFIKNFNLTPTQYGVTFTVVATAGVVGGIVNKRLQLRHSGQRIIAVGIAMVIAGSLGFLLGAALHELSRLNDRGAVIACIASQIINRLGVSFLMINGLTLSLAGYKNSIGTASSIFSLATYCVTAVITFGMSFLHNGQSTTMPIYFLGLSLFTVGASWLLAKNKAIEND